MSKAERHKNRKMSTLGTLGSELTSFGDLRALEEGVSVSGLNKRKRKSIRGKGKKSKNINKKLIINPFLYLID